jgi:hypothetical protein
MEHALRFTRRELLFRSTCALGGLSLTGYLPRTPDAYAAASTAREPFIKPRAKAVINIFLSGGPSQMDTFDYKPSLEKYAGKPLPFSTPKMANNIPNVIFRSPFKFAKHGQSGQWVSELLPHLAECVDDLTLIHSMTHDQPDHLTALCYANTGHERSGRPSLGAWVTYGLGSESKDLPGFVALEAGGNAVACGFLPLTCQATVFQNAAQPMADLAPREAVATLQRNKRSFLREINRLEAATRGAHPMMEAADACYDQALRMQKSVPALYDLSAESGETLALYGIPDEATRTVGTQCLIARRLIERGVRFVQINDGGWDHHGGLTAGIRAKAQASDRPIAGLLKDLKRRGLLDETLVMWGGEFGRTPIGVDGREHNPYGYTIWLAGGGTRPGFVYGATDEFGFYAIEKKTKVHDLHATILHLLGIDHNKLTFRFGGRDFRLSDVDGEVVHGIIA